MPGELPNNGITPEVEQKLTPREKLVKFLEKEKPGSIKSQAVADRARFELLEKEVRDATHKPDLMQGTELKQSIAQHAAINETIRVRKFGENGTEYTKAFDDSTSIFRDYCKDQVPPNSQYGPEFYTSAAALTIELDLLRINAIKSTQGNQ